MTKHFCTLGSSYHIKNTSLNSVHLSTVYTLIFLSTDYNLSATLEQVIVFTPQTQ